MKRMTWTLGIMIAAGVATAVAQPPAGRGGPGGGVPGGGPGGGRPPMPVIEVLDADHDHVISASELKNATSSLLTLDKNNDGKLTENEFGPRAGGGGRGQGGPQGGGRDNARRGLPGGPEGRGGRGPAGGPGDGPDGGPPPPSAERMVAHAMEFDADKDGKLSKDELQKFAEDFAKRHAGPGGPPDHHGGGPGPNDGEGGQRPQRPE